MEKRLKEIELSQAAQAQYVWVRASEAIWSNLVGNPNILEFFSVLSDAK